MDNPRVLLTAEDVQSWLAERARLEGEIADRQKRLAELDVKLSAATVFMGTDGAETVHAEPEPTHDEDPARESVSAGVLKILAAAKKALPPTAIRTALLSTEHADLIQRNPSYIYNVVSRLVKSGKITKRPGKRYTLPVSNSPHPAGIAGVVRPRLVSPQPSVEAVAAARKVGGT